MPNRSRLGVAAGCIITVLVAGCSAEELPQRDDGIVDVVASTPILADLAHNVAGDRARVTSLLPPGADPHVFEPTLRDIRAAANADLALTNHLLLEEQALISSIEQTGVRTVAVSEESERYGAQLLPLVEDVTLDTVWLGMRVADQRDVTIRITDVSGPGTVAAYLTGTFGQPTIYLDSSDGLGGDELSLPGGAHTHLSWAFSQPGRYDLRLQAQDTATGEPVGGPATVTVAVGVDPNRIAAEGLPAGAAPREIIDSGHQDIAVEDSSLALIGDGAGGADGAGGEQTNLRRELDRVVINVPGKALQEIPPEPQFRFLGRGETYLLPQAVLGKHVHGDVDPHTWHDVANTIAMVEVIRDELARTDPAGAPEYAANAERYIGRLRETSAQVQAAIDAIPPERRYLVTTHDGYGYLGRAYGLTIAGFISPNPSLEPSTRDLIALTNTLNNLHVPAVFIEPGLASPTLREIAANAHIDVCRIYGDAFDDTVTTYLDLMAANAASLKECLA